MARKGIGVKKGLGFTPPTALGRVMHAILTERNASGRQVSLAAGLSQDVIRNILDGRIEMPRRKTLDAIAAVLETTSEEILRRAEQDGQEAEGPENIVEEGPPASRQEVEAPRREDMENPALHEVHKQLRRPSPVTSIPVMDISGAEVKKTDTVWTLPGNFRSSIGADVHDLIVIPAPSSDGPIRRGDWLIVARTQSAGKGTAVLRMGGRHVLAKVSPTLSGKVRLRMDDDDVVEVDPDALHVVGEVVRYLAAP